LIIVIRYIMANDHIGEIISVYKAGLIRAYCWARFKIIRPKFLDEIGQYFPRAGNILDIGCGFGLFSLYYAKKFPQLQISGIDINAKRIALAQSASQKLHLHNVSYTVGDVVSLSFDQSLDCVYMLDIIHHIPRSAVKPLIETIYNRLQKGARLIIKDVETQPAWKVWFTYTLDKLLDLKAEVNYWDQSELKCLLTDVGFRVYSHSMLDILPYPHIIYICQKTES
jgi:ubiquinone/menaquinone biosynthesis C-methylase UbiE